MFEQIQHKQSTLYLLMKIQTSAYFEILPDSEGHLAQIVFRDGTRSQFLVTKSHAFDIGQAMIGVRMDENEWLAVKQQIVESEFLRNYPELEDYANRLNGMIEEVTRFAQKIATEKES